MKINKLKKSGLVSISLILTVLLLGGCLSQSNTKETKLAKVDSIVITETTVKDRYNSFPEEYRKTAPLNVNQTVILDQLINEEVLLSAARKGGYEKHADYQKQLTAIDQQVSTLKRETLINLLLRDKLKFNPVTDAEIKESYNQNKRLFASYQLRRVSHILVPTKKEALTIQKKVQNGQSFKITAKKLSQDPSSKQGGDIGWVKKGQVKLASLENAIFELKKKGSISKVVQTPLGFHIIKLTDIKKVPAQTYTQVKKQIQESMQTYKQNQAVTAYVDTLKKTHKIKRFDTKPAETKQTQN
ncbi:hypothetical protein DID80_00530 [Candidatus Marinamargulisbacteria bacterium SCGC AAA071-K20]|nr:hypothetical protein DID80_00530 [Candidatus Marinamargulisbacteria bacterium SCGC AAA071-K20]